MAAPRTRTPNYPPILIPKETVFTVFFKEFNNMHINKENMKDMYMCTLDRVRKVFLMLINISVRFISQNNPKIRDSVFGTTLIKVLVFRATKGTFFFINILFLERVDSNKTKTLNPLTISYLISLVWF